MGMRHVDLVTIQVEDIIFFSQQNLHMMFICLRQDLAVGDPGEVVLFFRSVGELKVKAVVKGQPVESMEMI
ncbi:MAG: hypothetical protein A2V66_09980 [Ignavibacteria bacterium RBG_13_36_8]|nr:MAG: hypothetical protein A2V66_09980 [Ignavibacteria bacterium RBG_13_36_8]